MKILITGASSGVGRALAEKYASSGVTLVLLCRCAVRLGPVVNACKLKGSEVIAIECDVRDHDKMKQLCDSLLAKIDCLDILIANAGIRGEEDSNYSNISVAKNLMDVNYFGVINSIVPFLASFKNERGGKIAVISSIAALRSTQNSGAYSASKVAIDRWCESLRLRLKKFDVSVTVVNLGFVETDMTRDITFNMPGLLKPHDAAELIAEAIRKKKRNTIIPLVSRIIWGSFVVMPGIFYDFLISWAKARQQNKAN